MPAAEHTQQNLTQVPLPLPPASSKWIKFQSSVVPVRVVGSHLTLAVFLLVLKLSSLHKTNTIELIETVDKLPNGCVSKLSILT